uniref:sushi, von Willebrand factor type A, EGF and pentraxin domain-containing protein 1-like isoform X1 n=1 Tax=Styela clava TaxID=7725 RepID=UPI00193ACBDB|nr:sushi, von Willebrand factor type A, EGF and pentraxin domain-containing protein 1-like isoform X1 [Styela clava]
MKIADIIFDFRPCQIHFRRKKWWQKNFKYPGFTTDDTFPYIFFSPLHGLEEYKKMSKLSIAVFLAIIGVSLAAGGCRNPDIKYGYCEPDMVGYVPRSFIPYGTVVKCHCDPGYDWTAESNSYECNYYGWDPRKFGNCVERTKCYPPPQPSKGSYSPVQKYYFYKQSITYECKYGYYLSNPKYTVRTCTASGDWDLPAPECLPRVKYCPNPPKISYGSFGLARPKYKFPDKIIYSCNVGFYMVGKAKYQCMKSGSWHPTPPPKCLPLCKQPSKPTKGEFEPIQDYYTVGAITTFTCEKYYELKGKEVLTCQKGGKWNYPSPTCQITCPRREAPENGKVTPSRKRYSVHEVIEFSCRDGYSLSGNSKDKCKSNGKWAVNKPVYCLKQCKVEDLAPYVTYSPEADYYDQGKVIYFKCDREHYHLVGEKKSRCSKGGNWDTEFPICVRKCYTPEIENGGVEDEKDFYLAREYIEYFCIDGYVLDGDDEGQCKANGQWSHVPTCKALEKKCRGHKLVGGGVKPSYDWYNAGSYVIYYCSAGYKLTGKYFKNRCNKDGTWQYPIPTCEKIIHEDSCYKRCGEKGDYFGYGCQCHYRCKKMYNCCPDYHKQCVANKRYGHLY